MQAHTAIGVISPQLSALYFGMLLQGIRAVAEQRGLRVVAIQSTPAQVAAAQLAVDYVTGWIVINDLTGIEQLTTLGAPVVTIGAVATDQAIPAILPDNQGGMHEAITHLIEHGHQRIAFAGDMRQLDMQQRYAGYLSAHTAAGLTTDPALLLDLDSNSIIMGTALARRLCDGELDCTALATATDELALGLLTALDQDKTNAPPLAVVGFDDILPAQFTRPPLTTVHVSVDLIGRIAAEQVLAETSPGQLPEQIVTVPTSLVRRQSCGCALQTPSEAAPDNRLHPDGLISLAATLRAW
jgi:DNA-binding LacI/PurR family transcriptional regulator